jgi:dolichyl-phosphate-mannose--protein O-mannosyl transferase
VSLILIPLVIQFLVHLPFFLAGFNLADFVDLQRARLSAREPGLVPATLNTDGTWNHPYASRWWEWPLALRPMWHSTIPVGDKIAVTYANGNPLLYWAFLPALAWLCRHWWRKRTPALLVLVIGFFGQWLPWMIVSHTSFIYHFLPAVPFGCLAVAVAVVHLAQSGDVRRRTAAIGYVALVALAFAFFYPIYSLYPLTERQLDLRMWFSSWR